MLDYLSHVAPLEIALGTTNDVWLAAAINQSLVALPTKKTHWKLGDIDDALGVLSTALAVDVVESIVDGTKPIPLATIAAIEAKEQRELDDADKAAFRKYVDKEFDDITSDEGMNLAKVGINQFLRDAGLAHVADLAASLSTVAIEELGRDAVASDVAAARAEYDVSQTQQANEAAFISLWATLQNDHLNGPVAAFDQESLAAGLHAAAIAAGYVE